MQDRLRFRDVLKAMNRGRPPFVPFAYGLAARTANVTVGQMASDPGYYTSALESIAGLLGLDMLVANFDSTLECEALGASVTWPGEYDAPLMVQQDCIVDIQPEDFIGRGRIPVVIETVKRLSLSSGGDKAVTCALLGPCAFVNSIQETFKDISAESVAVLIKRYGGLVTRLVRALCDQKVDALFFREDLLGKRYLDDLNADQAAYKSLYTTLFNIVKTFNAFPLIVAKHLNVEAIDEVRSMLKPNGMVLLGEPFDQQVLDAIKDAAKRNKISYGLPIPIAAGDQESLWSCFESLDSFISEHRLKNIFYSSDGEIPHDTDLGILLGLMDKVNTDNE